MHVCVVTLLMRRSMRCRVLCSGGRMLWVEEMVLCGLSCSMLVRRLCALGASSLFPLPSSVEMYRLSFSLRSTRFIPPRFLGGGFAAGARAFSQASVASWNSTAWQGSSILAKTTSLSSIMKSRCEDRHSGFLLATLNVNYTLWCDVLHFCFSFCAWLWFAIHEVLLCHEILTHDESSLNYLCPTCLWIHHYFIMHCISIKHRITSSHLVRSWQRRLLI